MLINADLTQPVTVHGSSLEWIASPAAGVDRKMLYREGAEVARATSIVRYAKGSAFPAHVHTGGEEILVLDGTFQDEHGDYPAGSYFRNPPGTSHSPAAAEGCTIFVRLWQHRAGDGAQIVRRPGEGDALAPRPGVAEAIRLFEDGAERVVLETWQPAAAVETANPRGLELLVVSGSARIGAELLTAQSWLRWPPGLPLTATAGDDGAVVWIKDAPLHHPDILKIPA
ncbi:cupin domain-containing protein [Frigidibacter sp. MR17.14]|uniref:cupin domain-containing protein n=1 Tax=Frigidibacter sp. MR17.14 TaxID=3126509 RepID=UPI003012B4D9